jgi:carbon-monoxide dehydrogenase medium subunit
MKAPPFAYHRPDTLEEALDLVHNLPDARIIAGGQSLLPMMNFRIAAPQHLIDIARVPGLSDITLTASALRIGAMVRQADALASPRVAAHAPLLAAAMRHIGHQQTRNRGTVGGSLCHLDPASEIPLVCATLDATLHVASRRGRRDLAFADFARGALATALEADEVLLHVDIPFTPAGARHGFTEYARRAGDFAIVAVAVVLPTSEGRITHPRLGVSGLGAAAARCAALEGLAEGQKLTPDLIRTLAKAASGLPAEGDLHHDSDYKSHLAGVLLDDVLQRIARHV